MEKQQPASLTEGPDFFKLSVHEHTLALELVRGSAILRVLAGESKPREFDFAKDRHIAPTDVDEYMGRRLLELVRGAPSRARGSYSRSALEQAGKALYPVQHGRALE